MYDNPPITESVIGISFKESIDQKNLDKLKSKLLKHYNNHQSIDNINLKVDVGDGENTFTKTDVNKEKGYKLSNSDLTELVIIFPKYFAISQLAPYPGWGGFFNRFKRDWEVLKRHLGYVPIKRIGVRYINRIDVPLDTGDVKLEGYLNIYPLVTNKFGPLTGYSVQTSIFMEDLECDVTINSGAIPAPILGHSSFIIDQDIAKSIDAPQNNEDIYALLGHIRNRKNEIFESCITDRSRALFENG